MKGEYPPGRIRSLPDRDVLGRVIVVGAEDIIGAEIKRSGARGASPASGSTRRHGRRDQGRARATTFSFLRLEGKGKPTTRAVAFRRRRVGYRARRRRGGKVSLDARAYSIVW